VTDQVGRVHQTRAVVAGDAVEKYRLSGRIGQQIRCQSHLLRGPSRASHRNNQPANARLLHHRGLPHELGITRVDRCESDNRPDPLALDEIPQRSRALPGAANQSPRNNDLHSFFEPLITQPHSAEHKADKTCGDRKGDEQV
jgi:hypothetical protein